MPDRNKEFVGQMTERFRMRLPELAPTDALLIIDMQKDFCPGGALPVTDCSRALEVLSTWLDAADQAGITIVASRDWHPPDHMSFKAQGGPWPEHCVRGTDGASFCEELHLPAQAVIINKGMEPDVEQYSAFDVGRLESTLRERGIRRLWVAGVAQEICVRAAVLDALQSGFEVHVIVEATAPVKPDDGHEALAVMQAAGAILE